MLSWYLCCNGVLHVYEHPSRIARQPIAPRNACNSFIEIKRNGCADGRNSNAIRPPVREPLNKCSMFCV